MLGILLLPPLLLLAACAPDMFERLLTPETRAFADQVQDALITRDAQRLRPLMDPELAARLSEEAVAADLETAPAAPASQKTLNATKQSTVTTAGASSVATLTRELTAPDGAVTLLHMVIGTSGDRPVLQQLNVVLVTEEMRAAGRLELAGKTPLHFIVLALAIAFPVIILATLVAIVRTRRLKRRILWFLFALVGVGTFTLDWANSFWNLNPLSFLLLGSAFQQVPYTTVYLQAALPLGAILFWFMRSTGRLRLKESPPPKGDGPVEQSA
jgi:hypothetical protein